MVAFCSVVGFTSTAQAETATYLEPDFISDDDLNSLSTAGDNAGYLLALGETLALRFNEPLTLNVGDRISVFSLPPDSGVSRAQIRFGSYNNGSPIILAARNFRGGNTRSINISGGLLSGCQILGGCDYIEIITTRTRRGAAGVEIDHVTVDGRVVDVAAPTPEPQTWALMIIAFAGVAARLKQARPNLMQTPRAASLPDRHSLALQGPAAPQTVHP